MHHHISVQAVVILFLSLCVLPALPTFLQAEESSPEKIPRAIVWSYENDQLFIDIDRRFTGDGSLVPTRQTVFNLDRGGNVYSSLMRFVDTGPSAWVPIFSTDCIVQSGDATTYARDLWSGSVNEQQIVQHLSGSSEDPCAQSMPLIDRLVAIRLAELHPSPAIFIGEA